MLALLWLFHPAGGPAQGQQPPTADGLTVQERLLRTQVRQIARGLVGERLVDVIVHIRYIAARGETPPSLSGRRVKLPGFNAFIDRNAGGEEVYMAYSRQRQITVLVAQTENFNDAELEQTLRDAGNFRADLGDQVEVLLVNQPPAPFGAADRVVETPFPPASSRSGAGLGGAGLGGTGGFGAGGGAPPLLETEASASLLQARQAFFRGSYQSSLQYILQALKTQPDNPLAHAMLGSLYYSVGWTQLAQKYWERALLLDPQDAKLRALLVRIRQG